MVSTVLIYEWSMFVYVLDIYAVSKWLYFCKFVWKHWKLGVRSDFTWVHMCRWYLRICKLSHTYIPTKNTSTYYTRTWRDRYLFPNLVYPCLLMNYLHSCGLYVIYRLIICFWFRTISIKISSQKMFNSISSSF